MGRDTRLRAKTKKEYDTGASIYTILHPNTTNPDPSSLMPSSELLRQQILSSDFSNVNSNSGYASDLVNNIKFDLAHAIRIYNAFGIDPNSETATAELETELTNYELTTESKDINELENDIINNTIQALKANNAPATDIGNSFVRSSIIKGVITLELLATHLGIVVTLDILDLDLAILIRAEIDLL